MRGGGLAKWLVKNGKGAKDAVADAAKLVGEKAAKGAKEAGTYALGAGSLGTKAAARAVEKNPKAAAALAAGGGAAIGASAAGDDDKKKKKKRPYLDEE